jgi:hypothetical protein
MVSTSPAFACCLLQNTRALKTYVQSILFAVFRTMTSETCSGSVASRKRCLNVNRKYLDKVCEVFDLRKYMTFNTEVIGCYWNEDEGQWTVKLRQNHPGTKPEEFEEKCDVLLHATGFLNNFKWPEVKGLEKFKGKVIRKSHPKLLSRQVIDSTFKTLLIGPRITKRNSGRMNQLLSSVRAHHRYKLCQICSHM